MSCQQVTQNIADDIIVLLTNGSVAVTGLTFSDVTAQFRKEGGAFQSKTLTALNFTEVGNGFYEIDFTASELNTLGQFLVVVDGVAIDQSNTMVEVVGSSQPTTSTSLSTCVVYGHLFDAGGDPLVGAAVSARPVGLPAIEQSAAAISDDLVTAVTDSNGEFFLTLIRLADMEVFIPAVGLRKRIVVPNASTARLYDIP